jgi:arylsulfatase B
MGKLLTRLDELSLAENTIVIFMTDNGHSGWNLPKKGPFFYNAGMRGWKGSNYEGGHRVPCFIRWPGGNIQGGKDITKLTAHYDLMPTLIELCQLDNQNDIDFDGRSLVPLLTSGNPRWEERILFVDNQRVEKPVKWKRSSVMSEQYRLINGKELYDMRNDPGQKTDISEDLPEVVRELGAEYDSWWTDISGSFEEFAWLYLGHEHDNPTRLTCHDWHSEESLKTWNQEVIRNRQHQNGFWTVEVVQDGDYKFTCRTYPMEEDTRMNVTRVRIKIGDQEVESECYPGSSEVTLRLNLKKGKTRLQSWFYEEDGNSFGVPFIYIRRL